VVLTQKVKKCSYGHLTKQGSITVLRAEKEGDGAINGYLAESDRKPIPGRRASNRTGEALPSGSLRAGNNKFRLHGRAETAASLDLRGGATELTQVWRV